MRVLHLIDSAGVYGAEKMLLALCVAQRELGVDASVLSARLPEEPSRAIDVELRNSSVPVLSWPMRAGLNFRAMRNIHAWAVKHRVDVLHSHGYKFNVLLALTHCRKRIVRLATVHGYTGSGLFDRMTVYNMLDRLSHLAFDRVVYVSPALQRRLLLKASKRSSIPNGIDVASLPMTGLHAREAAADDAGIRLLAVGRLAAEKDYELLLRAAALLGRRGVTFSLDIFGEGPEEASLRRIIAEERLDRVKLRGYSDKISTELGLHDVLVVSSKAEGMPIALIEGMCLGIRIVATPVGGIPALLKNYPHAIIVKTRSEVDLANAIQAQIGNSGLLESTELARIRGEFSSATMARRYLRLYEGMTHHPAD